MALFIFNLSKGTKHLEKRVYYGDLKLNLPVAIATEITANNKVNVKDFIVLLCPLN